MADRDRLRQYFAAHDDERALCASTGRRTRVTASLTTRTSSPLGTYLYSRFETSHAAHAPYTANTFITRQS